MKLRSSRLPEAPLAFIKECVSSGRLRWTFHGTIRLQQRLLSPEILLRASPTLEIIESYPDDKYLPSFLVRGEDAGLVFHALIATDVEAGNIRVVTIYVPSRVEWDEKLRIRRTIE